MGTIVNILVLIGFQERKEQGFFSLSVEVGVNLQSCFLESNKVKIDLEYCNFQHLPLSEAICLSSK